MKRFKVLFLAVVVLAAVILAGPTEDPNRLHGRLRILTDGTISRMVHGVRSPPLALLAQLAHKASRVNLVPLALLGSRVTRGIPGIRERHRLSQAHRAIPAHRATKASREYRASKARRVQAA
jgi:hypothetical protein